MKEIALLKESKSIQDNNDAIDKQKELNELLDAENFKRQETISILQSIGSAIGKDRFFFIGVMALLGILVILLTFFIYS